MNLDKFFTPSFQAQFKKPRTSHITELLYQLDYKSHVDKTPRLSNPVAAGAIVDVYPTANTSHKSVASIRSKQKDRIQTYFTFRDEGHDHFTSFAAARDRHPTP